MTPHNSPWHLHLGLQQGVHARLEGQRQGEQHVDQVSLRIRRLCPRAETRPTRTQAFLHEAREYGGEIVGQRAVFGGHFGLHVLVPDAVDLADVLLDLGGARPNGVLRRIRRRDKERDAVLQDHALDVAEPDHVGGVLLINILQARVGLVETVQAEAAVHDEQHGQQSEHEVRRALI